MPFAAQGNNVNNNKWQAVIMHHGEDKADPFKINNDRYATRDFETDIRSRRTYEH